MWVNDIHSQLNATHTRASARPTSVQDGTVRLIERDEESFLAWARESWACIIFNLHVVHGGSYYLTYHRWANRAEVGAAYPQFAAFLRLKRRYDPEERFQSDWYRQCRDMFAGGA